MNSAVYHGRVKIKIVKDSDILYSGYYHNSGTDNMCKLVAKSMAGYDISKERPTKIRLTLDGTAITIEDSGLTGIYYTQDTIESVELWVTRFAATISGNNLSSEIDTSKTYTLQLIDNLESVLATVEVPGTDLEDLMQGTQAVIEWTIYVTLGE